MRWDILWANEDSFVKGSWDGNYLQVSVDFTLGEHFLLIDTVMKLLRLVYCRWSWQVFSLDPLTHAYRPDNAKRIAGFTSNNILFREVIQPQANRENYDTDIFELIDNEEDTKCTI